MDREREEVQTLVERLKGCLDILNFNQLYIIFLPSCVHCPSGSFPCIILNVYEM